MDQIDRANKVYIDYLRVKKDLHASIDEVLILEGQVNNYRDREALLLHQIGAYEAQKEDYNRMMFLQEKRRKLEKRKSVRQKN